MHGTSKPKIITIVTPKKRNLHHTIYAVTRIITLNLVQTIPIILLIISEMTTMIIKTMLFTTMILSV